MRFCLRGEVEERLYRRKCCRQQRQRPRDDLSVEFGLLSSAAKMEVDTTTPNTTAGSPM
jgi:hypothetical protein